MLLRSDQKKELTAKAVAGSIFANEQETANSLAQLAAREILVPIGTQPSVSYRYQPNAEMDRSLGRAADLYRQYLIPITHLIHSKSKTKVQEFADAFKIRKD